MSRFGDDGAHRVASAKTLATVLHLHQGTPYVYQGDELGMANAPFAAIGDFRDIQTLNYYAQAAARGDVDLAALLAAMPKKSRDQGRTPVQWDASPTPASPPEPPWIAVNPDYVKVNAAAQVGQPGSVFEHYRRLIELRHADPVVTDGDFELLLPDHPAIWAFLRRGPDTELLVAANFSADVTGAALPLHRRLGRRGRRPDQPAQPGTRSWPRRTSSSAPWESDHLAPHQVRPAQPIAAAMISRAWSWMAARCSSPRNDSAYSL